MSGIHGTMEAEDPGIGQEQTIQNMLKIDPLELERELVGCAATIAYMGAIHARVLETHSRAKARAERTRSLVWIEERERLQNEHGSGRGGATEKLIEAFVSKSYSVQSAEDEAITTEVALSQARSNLQAALARKDVLVAISANRRAEMQLDPSIRDVGRAQARRKLEGE